MQLWYKEARLHHKLAPEFGNVISVVQMVLVLKMKIQDRGSLGEKLRPDSVWSGWSRCREVTAETVTWTGDSSVAMEILEY